MSKTQDPGLPEQGTEKQAMMPQTASRPVHSGGHRTIKVTLVFVCYFHPLQEEKKQASGRGCSSGDFPPCVQSKVVWTALDKCLIALWAWRGKTSPCFEVFLMLLKTLSI